MEILTSTLLRNLYICICIYMHCSLMCKLPLWGYTVPDICLNWFNLFFQLHQYISTVEMMQNQIWTRLRSEIRL